MSRGLALPVGATNTGSSKQTEGDEQASKVILLALSDNDNDNAFQQDEGLGAAHVFQLSDAGTRAYVNNRLKEIFAKFARVRLYQLQQSSIKWAKGDEAGDKVLEFKYINLETNEVQEFKKVYRAR